MQDPFGRPSRLVPGNSKAYTHPGPAGSAAAAYRLRDHQTATPRRLAELLYDAATRLGRRAVEAMDDGDLDLAADRLGRARGILRQLIQALPHDAGRDVGRLADFCKDVLTRLTEAEHYRRRESAVEAIGLLTLRRDDWSTGAWRCLARDRACAHPAPSADWIG